MLEINRKKRKQEPAHGADTKAKYEIVVSLQTDVGCHRDVNEDCGRYINPDDSDPLAHKGSLFLVADGMGGHSAGEVASRVAVDVISRVYYQSEGDAQSTLKKAFDEANREIYEESLKSEKYKGMGTTCTAIVLQNGSAIAAHIGDSRLYLVRDEQIYLMTEDHSSVMEMVKRGLISLEQARVHPDKNVILRALGTHPEVEVSTWQEPFPVRIGDQFLLCSDGLYDLVTDDEIKQALMDHSRPRVACETLIELAKERGGHDNITVGVIKLIAPTGGKKNREVPETREVEVVK